uniref:Uncharacterized protein n=1 Tax=Arundo donax TaxID=35708 RepID=A0A0A9IEI2_ARUDO
MITAPHDACFNSNQMISEPDCHPPHPLYPAHTVLPLVHSSERSLRYTGKHLPHLCHPWQMSQSMGCSL